MAATQAVPVMPAVPVCFSGHGAGLSHGPASVLSFIEANWLGGRRIGGGSFDAISGNLTGMFQFFAPRRRPVILNPATGAVVKQ